MDPCETAIAVVLFNLVLGVVCSFGARHAWGHYLSLVALAVNVLPTLLALTWAIGIATGRYHLGGLEVSLIVFMLVEQIWFLSSFRRYRHSQLPLR